MGRMEKRRFRRMGIEFYVSNLLAHARLGETCIASVKLGEGTSGWSTRPTDAIFAVGYISIHHYLYHVRPCVLIRI